MTPTAFNLRCCSSSERRTETIRGPASQDHFGLDWRRTLSGQALLGGSDILSFTRRARKKIHFYFTFLFQINHNMRYFIPTKWQIREVLLTPAKSCYYSPPDLHVLSIQPCLICLIRNERMNFRLRETVQTQTYGAKLSQSHSKIQSLKDRTKRCFLHADPYLMQFHLESTCPGEPSFLFLLLERKKKCFLPILLFFSF